VACQINDFGNLGRCLPTEKLKGSLTAPVLITSKCVTGFLWQSFQHNSVILIGSVNFADRQWRLSKQGTGSPLHFWGHENWNNYATLQFFSYQISA